MSFAGVLTDKAVTLAQTGSEVDQVAEKAAAAVTANEAAPSAVLAAVLDARTTWSGDQVAQIYREILFASGLSGQLIEDLDAYQTESVKMNSREGVKLLDVLYTKVGATVAGDVVASVVGSASAAYASAAVGRQVSSSATTSVAAGLPPVLSTPPAVSSDN